MPFEPRAYALSRRPVLAALAAAAVGLRPAAARSKPVVVGWLGWVGSSGVQASALALEAFRGELQSRGWAEGRDLTLHALSGDQTRSAALATELMKQEPDLVVAQGPMVFGARNAVGQRPLLFNINGDPVEAGLVASLARPGGTMTGISALSADLAAKRLELLKEAMGKGTRVALLANSAHPGVKVEHEANLAAAPRLGLNVSWHPIKSAAELDGALAAIAQQGTDALLAIPDNLINRLAQPIAEFAAARKLPTMSGWSEFVDGGNLLSYGPNYAAFFRQMGAMANRLLRGARAADTAVELPREIELVVNTRVARAFGLELPASLLLRADRRLA
ncbi:MAG: hypothetical protein RJA10_4798 [Pseudomonadota bacterium]|jgi:putative tryptophan/tyrosine transport system substrate-binding protein